VSAVGHGMSDLVRLHGEGKRTNLACAARQLLLRCDEFGAACGAEFFTSSHRRLTVTKMAILPIAFAAMALTTGVAFALSGAAGLADRITIREGYPQYEGKIDLRDSTGAVNFYYWGGTRCAIAAGPSDRQVDFLLNAHLHGHQVSLDYSDVVSAFGTSRCWDGGVQIL